MVWTVANDIISAWVGHDVPTDEVLVDQWIGKAERLLRREFPTLPERIDSGREPDLLDTVKDVVTAMVTRVFRNPEGVRQRQETDGSFMGSITFAGDQPGGLVLLDSERAALREPDAARPGQAFSVNVGGTCSQHLPWCDHTWTAGCSCGANIAGKPIYEGGYGA